MKQSRTKHEAAEGAAILAVVLGLTFIGYLSLNPPSKSFTGTETARRAMSLPDFVPVARRFAPSFVHIATTIRPGAEDARYRDDAANFASSPLAPSRHGIGAGIIINRDGHILTNYHVVERANTVTVKLADRRELEATVVGRDAGSDIAVMKVAAPVALRPAPLGDSSLLEAGDWVVAMGSPFGLDRTFTAGIVSAKSRRLAASPYYDYIQTDASINPGNSGGPLLNLAGQVVGINTAILSPNGANTGINFAIPINLAKDFLPQLLSKGRITRGWLGISTQNVSARSARLLGLQRAGGALVVDVVADGPAAKAGLEAGDVILGYDGHAVSDSEDLPSLVAETPVGRNVAIYISRQGILYRAAVSIGQLPEEELSLARATKVRKTH
jgi:serine protease Do